MENIKENKKEFYNEIYYFSKDDIPVVEKLKDIIDWGYISKFYSFDYEFIDKFKDKLIWFILSRRDNLTNNKDFILRFSNNLDWCGLSHNKYLSEDIIDNFSDKIDWDGISIHSKQRSRNFINKYKDRLNWSILSYRYDLTEDDIREHIDEIDWKGISQCQRLSESFIEEFSNKLNLKLVSKLQELSQTFIENHMHELYWIDIIPRCILCTEEEFKNIEINNKYKHTIFLEHSFINKYKNDIIKNIIEDIKISCKFEIPKDELDLILEKLKLDINEFEEICKYNGIEFDDIFEMYIFTLI